MSTNIRACTPDDANELHELSCKTFDETFSEKNTPANMKTYLQEAFNIDKLRAELSNGSSLFFFIFVDEELAGYIKMNEYAAQTDIFDPLSIEVERIYVIKELKGRGYGSALMHKAVDISRTQKKSYIWLGVWEKNENAISFYESNGFYLIGEHSFFVGEEEQTDFIMRKDLEIDE